MPKNLLLIDDDADTILALKIALEAEGFTVQTALNGKEGLELIESTLPDLIILDIKMPVMNGIEFLKTVESDDNYSKIPIIVLSAISELQDDPEFQSISPYEYLEKPLPYESIVKEIKHKLGIPL